MQIEVVFAQLPEVKTTVDKNQILIGEQFNVTIEAHFNSNQFTTPQIQIADSLLHFEKINTLKADSIFSNDQLIGTRQQFIFTSFDSGKWIFPDFGLRFADSNSDSVITVFSDSFPMAVSFSVADTSSQLKDIYPIKEIKKDIPYWYWIAVIGSALLLIVLIYFLYKNWKRKSNLLVTPEDAFVNAMAALQSLKILPLQEMNQLRHYHTQLSTICKNYLSAYSGRYFLNDTTSDLLIKLKSMPIEQTLLTSTASALRCGDAVKFAKYIASTEENTNCVHDIELLIQTLHQQQKLSTTPTP